MIVCACEPYEQLRRLIERDGLPEEAARARLAAQWPIGEKVARADYVIRTDESFARPRRRCGDVVSGADVRLTLRRAFRVSRAGAIRSSTNVFHSWQCGHCQSSSVLR